MKIANEDNQQDMVYVLDSYEFGIQGVYESYADAEQALLFEYLDEIQLHRDQYNAEQVCHDLHKLKEKGYIEDYMYIITAPFHKEA